MSPEPQVLVNSQERNVAPAVERGPAPQEQEQAVARQTPEMRPANASPAEQVRVRPTLPATAQTILPSKSEQLKVIETVLEEDLADEYIRLTPQQQQRFRKTGEQTAAKIDELLKKTKVRLQKLIRLITQWLKLIPHVNKFFIQQEAKIKAEKILKLKQ